jgi:exodeoxyribonuclease V gamma subunit
MVALPPPGLHLIHGNDPEALREAFIGRLQDFPLPPLDTDLLIVESLGVAQWLRVALSERNKGPGQGGCGVAMGLEAVRPSAFQWRAYWAILPHLPQEAPLEAKALVWRVFRLLDGLVNSGHNVVYTPLARFLADDHDALKRLQLAENLAELFDRYQTYRGEWLALWENNQDRITLSNGTTQNLPTDQRWQAALWRAIVDDVRKQHQISSPTLGLASVHQAFLEAIAKKGTCIDKLPSRVVVFGLSALAPQTMAVLKAVAEHREVLIFVHNPCQYDWRDAVAESVSLLPKHPSHRPRHTRIPDWPPVLTPANCHAHAHPLLASWGKTGRDFLAILETVDTAHARAASMGIFHDRISRFSPPQTQTLLGQLQTDILDSRSLGATQKKWPAVSPTDESIRFHAVHSEQREVEVLHDALLAAFQHDPALQPRQVLVLLPDVEAYLPHIHSVFGRFFNNDNRFIPFAFADRGVATDPLVQALEGLLNLHHARFSASQILAWLDVPAIRKRFGIYSGDRARLHRWIRESGARWGLDKEQRATLDIENAEHSHTWDFALSRMFLGYAVGDQAPQPWQDIEPYDEIGGLEADRLGHLDCFLGALHRTENEQRKGAMRTPEAWCAWLDELLNRFFEPTSRPEAYMLEQLRAALLAWKTRCDEAAFNEELPLARVRSHWLSQVSQEVRGLRFLAGAVVFASLIPMRPVPFRRIYLLGLHDGAFPRAKPAPDFDLMALFPHFADRSRREDERYLFLETLLLARDHIHLSWIGNRIQDNTARPPSVLVGQLQDHLQAGWRLQGGGSLLDALTLHHPLQPFNPLYFNGKDPRYFSYANEWCVRALPANPAGFAPLPKRHIADPLTVADLVGLLKNPAKTFFQKRLGVYFNHDDPATEDEEPFEIAGLEAWALWDEIIRPMPALRPPATPGSLPLETTTTITRMQHRGALPLAGFGDWTQAEFKKPLPHLWECYTQALNRWPISIHTPVDVDIAAADLSVKGRFTGLRKNREGQWGRVLLDPSDLDSDESKVLRAWVEHVLIQAVLEDATLVTVILGRSGNGFRIEWPVRGEKAALPPHKQAQTYVAYLLDCWNTALCAPLPAPPKTALTWLKTHAKAVSKGKNPGICEEEADAAAQAAYDGNEHNRGERDFSPEMQRAWPDYEALVRNEDFLKYAEKLFAPLLAAIRPESRR